MMLFLACISCVNSLSGQETKAKLITFDNIKLETEAGAPYDESLLTDEVKLLDDVRVQLRGFMLPGARQEGIKNFILVRDNLECCFGPNAAIHDSVVVVLEKGTEVSFTVRPVSVEGTFQLKELRPRKDSRPLAIYRMIDAKLTR
ncbi:MAG TPA: DUF3299 domain-containing protein [Pirellulaceae bacterium]|nr:DUF3299 domain-containing protein [Pirellulaceae bacterium]HMP68181.1 DUF3299 domain-containing protein [Pirellulaceae bacterium]